MFDANMRYLPCGFEFFAKIHSCESVHLASLGFSEGDLIKCKMLSTEHSNPLVRLYSNSGRVIEAYHRQGYYETFIVYEGRIDGTDFIDEESRKIAMKMLEGGKLWVIH